MAKMTESMVGERVVWSGMTDVGRFRKNNEDAFLALMVDEQGVHYLGKEGDAVLGAADFIFAVSDGMGGANAGEFASKIAVQKIFELISRRFRPAAPGFGRGEIEILRELFEEVHTDMQEMGCHYEECRGMGATLSLCWITPERTYFAHIGDSRMYYLPAGEPMIQLTEDHSHVGRLLRKGKISEYRARTHPERNVLEQVLGGNTIKIEPQTGTVIPQSGDRFVLCTDGINDAISNRTIENLMVNPPPRTVGKLLSQRLVDESYEESGRDNLTALVVELGETEASTAKTDRHV